MKALDDPNLQTTGGKRIEEEYNPNDDIALMRLIAKIEAEGGATLEQKLLKYADTSRYISQAQFEGMLVQHQTLVSDFLPLNRIAGFAFMNSGVKKDKVANIMYRVNNRGAMREKVEEEALQLIAKYLDKKECTLKQLFDQFNRPGEDEWLSDQEFFQMLDAIHVPRNR